MIINSLDNSGKFQYIFGSEFTVSNIKAGDFHIRDLNHLNRSLSQIIVLDHSDKEYHLQPENVLLLPKFDGESNDDELAKASVLLQCKKISFNVKKRLGKD